MEVFQARTLEEALEIKAEHPEAVPIAGGTDLMVDLNLDRHRPRAIVDICGVGELRQWRVENGNVFLGSGMTYARIMMELGEIPAWVQAARTVGSPQIRNRGTIGGNLGTASPAGDALPVLAALDAEIVLSKAGGKQRALPWNGFMIGVKETALEPDELILGARWRTVRGPSSFSKVGARNAMVISIVGLCFVFDEAGRSVRVALGSVAPTVVRASDAESLLADALKGAGSWEDPEAPVAEGVFDDFSELVVESMSPIDDVRGTAAYRRHACSVLSRRALSWALEDRRRSAGGK